MKKMTKIAVVIAELGMPGGAEKVAADLIVEFHRRGHEVTVIRFDRPFPGEVLHQVPGHSIHIDLPEQRGNLLFQLGLMLRRAWQFRRVFRQQQFDYIFSFLEAANLPCALASADAVLSMHLDPNTLTRLEWLAIRWIYPRARRVIAVSQQMQQAIVRKTGLRNTCCIYNPIDTQLIRAQARQQLNIDSPFILAVGRLDTQKRFDVLLEAFARMRCRQQCSLVIVGDGSQQPALEQQIQALGLDQQVWLAGFDANPYKYMARARLLVMSSDYEGYPLVLIETLALGCPVVSTDCPTGPREIIQPGKNGLLVPKNDPEALAANVDRLFFDTVLHKRMSIQAAISVQGNDIAAIADAWLAV